MCYVLGSMDQAAQECPMCQVFPHPRCPHQRQVCQNRALHPRFDVSYLKNAEVESFNGCGYCKWARTSPPHKLAGQSSQGWPGCCRPPAVNEYPLIQPADWRSVSIIHQVPIPPEIKAAFSSFGKRGSPTPASARPIGKASTSTVPDRRNGATLLRNHSNLGRISSSFKPSSSSPRQSNTTIGLVTNLSRSSSTTAISSSLPISSLLDQSRLQSSEKRIAGTRSSNSSPKSKNLDLDAAIMPRRGSTSKTPPDTASCTSGSAPKLATEARLKAASTFIQRRQSVSNSKSSSTTRNDDGGSSSLVSRTWRKDDDMSSSSSGGSSSDGLGSMSDSTVTSDGGFTDYLSDESEAELQRQAEARAALLAQNQAEELEFKAVRQQLAHIDLRPPKSWNPSIHSSPTSRLARDSPITYPSRSARVPVVHAAR